MKNNDHDKQKASPRTFIPLQKHQQEKRKHSQIKTHQVNIPSQTIPSNPINPTIQKDPKLSSTYRHRLLKQNPQMRNSISSKEDFHSKNANKAPMSLDLPSKKQSKPNQLVKSNPQNTPQATGNSNCVLTTNYSDKEDEKKTKTAKQEMTLSSLKHLGNLFRSSNLKQTIIIDDEGNNNLNLNLKQLTNRKTFIKSNIECNPLAIDPNTPKSDMPVKISYQQVNNNNPSQNQGEPNRLNEYKMIFNLLNSNIDQMKNIIEKNYEATQPNSNTKPTALKTKEPQVSNRIISEKDVEEINRISPNDQPTEIINNTVAENETKNAQCNENYSFLDSCINEDFYDLFIKQSIKKDDDNNDERNVSFEYSTIVPKSEGKSNKNAPSLNLNDQTECENYEEEGRDNKINLHAITPHFLLHKANTFPKRSTKQQEKKPSKEDNEAAVDKNKCFIF